MRFSPGTTGEALNWKVMVMPPPLTVSLSAEVPLTLKSPGWTVVGSTGALMLTTKSVNWVNTVLSQAGWEPTTEQGGSLGVGVGVGLEGAVAVAVAVGVDVAVAVGVNVAVAVGVDVAVAVGVDVAVAVGVNVAVAVGVDVAVAVGVEVAVAVAVAVGVGVPAGTRNA
jgi:hypothetical protein